MKRFFNADVVAVALAANEVRFFKIDPKISNLMFNWGAGAVECLPRPVYDELQKTELSSTAKTNLRALWKVDSNYKELEFDTSKFQYDEYVLVNPNASASAVLIERQFVLV